MLEVICGCMFSGKTEELARRVRRALYAYKFVQLFRPELDTRATRTLQTILPMLAVNNLPTGVNLLDAVAPDVSVVVLDEAQFFTSDTIVQQCETLVDRGVTVIVAGLDVDAAGKPFGPMPQFLAVADSVTKLTAVCMRCSRPATRTYRKFDSNKDQIQIGDAELYEARCRDCWREQH